MRRAWERSVALLAFVLVWLFAAPALAFHAGSMFSKAPGAGGGGGIFYTGSPRDKAWNCKACHTEAAEMIQIHLDADQGLFSSFSYEPSKVYTLTATLVGEHAGLGSSTANFNGMAVVVVDGSGNIAGSLSGQADEFVGGGTQPLVTAGQKVGETKWVFRWTAPASNIGKVKIHLAAVDGDAAGGTTGTLTDPWGDDVFVGALELGDGGAAMKWDLSLTVLLSLFGLVFATSCGEGATKENPCPRGICTGQMTTTGSGGASSSATNSSSTGTGCQEMWSCTPWMDRGDGMFVRKCVDLAKCGTTNNKPNEGPEALPDLDFDFYKCKVEPIFDRGCSMMGCHGKTVERDFRIFARGRKRNDQNVSQVPTCPIGPQQVNLDKDGTGTVMCVGWSPHTKEEWQQNYDNARAFMIGIPANQADQSDLLAQPTVGGKVHSGVHLFKVGDPDYQTIKDWLGGKKLGAPCDPSPN